MRRWSHDVEVEFEQARLDDDDLADLFVDVKAHATTTLAVNRTVAASYLSGSKAVGAVDIGLLGQAVHPRARRTGSGRVDAPSVPVAGLSVRVPSPTGRHEDRTPPP